MAILKSARMGHPILLKKAEHKLSEPPETATASLEPGGIVN